MIFNFPLSPPEVVAHYLKYFGPTQNTFNALENEKDKQTALRSELENLWKENNLAADGTTRVESEYLEVVARRE